MRFTYLAVVMALSLAGCTARDGSGSTSEQPQQIPPPSSGSSRTDVATSEAKASVVPGSVAPGTTSTVRATLTDGTDLIYAVVTPADFDAERTYPVVLALPPGDQGAGVTVNVTQGTYAAEAIERGWVVVSPAAPNSRLFFQGSETLIEEFLDDLLEWLEPEGGRFHLVGISNGGISAFRLAALYPERFRSMVVFPGYALSDDDQSALANINFPVWMFVGGDDTAWIGPSRATLDLLSDSGKTASLEIREGEGHVMQSLADGVEIFDLLESAR